MKPERWEQVAQLHRAALDHEESDRVAFLKQACAGDEELRQEVLSLLAYEGKTGSFMESPALEVAAKQLARAGALGTVLVSDTTRSSQPSGLAGWARYTAHTIPSWGVT